MTGLTRRSAVCALVPHRDAGDWLSGAIESLLTQTRPPDAIVVIDDASVTPPRAVATSYPEVTLLRSPANVGPYRLVQTVVEQTDFDAYLFQDADDVSHPERLATLLEAAETDEAGMVGSQETELDVAGPEVRTRTYPWDVNAALDRNPIAFALLHPSSLVARDVIMRAGGYPGGLRFSGDVEFLRRAMHVAKGVNVAQFCYLRRIRAGSLTTSASTGMQSPQRIVLMATLHARARANAELVARGIPPVLEPLSVAPPVRLTHLVGPPLRTRNARRRPSRVVIQLEAAS